MDILQAALVRGIFWFIRLIPVRLAGAIGAGLGRLGFYLVKHRRRIAVRNLARIYPKRTRQWRHRIARESFAEMGRTIFEIPHVFLRSRAFLQSRVQMEGEGKFYATMAEEKGAFVAFCHHSNWEMCGLMYSMLKPESSCIYRSLRQPSLEHYVKKCRERFGAAMHPRQKGLRWLPRALKKDSSVAILLDQHISGGMPVPFLGHLANTTTVPAVFACKYDTPVFGMALHRIGKGFNFKLQFWPIPSPEVSGDKDADYYHLMHNINRSFEDIIHQRPELWLWSHRRWRILEENPQLCEAVHGTP